MEKHVKNFAAKWILSVKAQTQPHQPHAPLAKASAADYRAAFTTQVVTQCIRLNGMPEHSKGRRLSALLSISPYLLETEMPKMKTKSGAKKRFKITKSGKVKAGQAGKRHGMIKRTNDQIRKLRGTTVLKDCDAKVIKKKYMPYG